MINHHLTSDPRRTSPGRRPVQTLTAIITITLSVVLLGCHAQTRVGVAPGPNPWTHLRFNSDPRDFQFAIIPDRTGRVRPGVWANAIEKLNLLQPEFVITVGDIIEGYEKSTEQVHAEWDAIQTVISQLDMPFFYIPGNHDYYNDATKQVWAQRFGRDYYHFLYNDVLFLCLNGAQPIADEQIDYFARALEDNHNVRWTLVFIHKPRWARKDPSDWDRFETLLAERDYTVFAGHSHVYEKRIRNGHNYYTLATAGGKSGLSGPQHGEFDHITWVTMTDNGPKIANLLLDGILDDDPRQ